MDKTKVSALKTMACVPQKNRRKRLLIFFSGTILQKGKKCTFAAEKWQSGRLRRS